jgi:DNA-binding GntR family transcriptional regulator
MEIMQAMIAGNVEEAQTKMRKHIMRSSAEATEAVRKAYARIYVPDETTNGSEQ